MPKFGSFQPLTFVKKIVILIFKLVQETPLPLKVVGKFCILILVFLTMMKHHSL